jgi:hypothetical protein
MLFDLCSYIYYSRYIRVKEEGRKGERSKREGSIRGTIEKKKVEKREIEESR